jgi:hypothetical protein
MTSVIRVLIEYQTKFCGAPTTRNMFAWHLPLQGSLYLPFHGPSKKTQAAELYSAMLDPPSTLVANAVRHF